MRRKNSTIDKLLEDGLIEEHDNILLEKVTYGPGGLEIKGKAIFISLLLHFSKTGQN